MTSIVLCPPLPPSPQWETLPTAREAGMKLEIEVCKVLESVAFQYQNLEQPGQVQVRAEFLGAAKHGYLPLVDNFSTLSLRKKICCLYMEVNKHI